MEKKYKIIVSNKNLYKEIELSSEKESIRIGTGIECDARLHKDLFFEPVELHFIRNENSWTVTCSDNLYFTVGDVRKLMTKSLEHGERFILKYRESNNDVFCVDFLIDFNNEERRFERNIDISSKNKITIGTGTYNNIIISSDYIINDQIELDNRGNELILDIKNSKYGVYHNGNKANSNEIISDGDFFSISDFIFYYKNQHIWTEIRDSCLVNGLTYTDYPNKNSYPKFNRNTRIKHVLDDTNIEILDPPTKPQKPKNNLLMRLFPSMGMVLAAGAMAFMGGAMVIFSVISGVMAIVTTIINVFQNNKDFKISSVERIEKYRKYISEKRNEIEVIRKKELEILNSMYPCINKEEQMFDEFSADLFDRVQTDEDFLHVRLGTGSVEARKKINYKKQEKLEVEDELQELPEQVAIDYKLLHKAPIVCDFKNCNAIGVYGSEEYRYELMKSMIIDLCSRQFYSDVHLIFIALSVNEKKVEWMRHLPHVYNDITNTRDIACDDESKNIVFEYLYKELTYRKHSKAFNKRIIIFLYDEYGFKNHPISKFVSEAKELGVTFIFFEEEKSQIPQGCDYLIRIKTETEAELIDSANGEKTTEFKFENISDTTAKKIIDLIPPIYTEEISLEGTLTKNITLFKLLNILAVDDLDLSKRWASSTVFQSMATPIGISKTSTIYLDLHDKAHGPHGLVAGTTGSGKSEILQTYILSTATLFHPYEIAFLIIDFKGGGMVNQFKELPHLLGAITNIDGKEINRSLKSIKAELQKRQRLFAEAEVNHIDKYIKKFKTGEATQPLPHLIIIVDEFAELKAEQPEFMKELISAARIGRSLGVHLILATQKPSGQVNEQIWSNSRFKLCLKVQNQEDSNEVLKSPLAAEIKEPGRAYLQVGNNEIFELFQSAYSGAPEKVDDSNVKEFTIYSLNTSGKRTTVYTQKKKKNDDSNLTQLDAIVGYVSDYCSTKQIVKLPNICLPPLEDCIKFDATLLDYDMNRLPIGIYDDPDTQCQGSARINIYEENTLIIGSSQTGKTNFLQLIIRMLVNKYSPKEVVVYIADFGAMYLKNFEELNHIGGVVIASEEERIKNLFKLLSEELQYRKAKFMQSGLSSFAAYKEAGYSDLPKIFFIIDNFSAFKELYADKYEDVFMFLTREGIACGISIIITNSQTNGIGFKYMSNFACRLALKCNDSSEYGILFDRCRIEPKDVPGRMLFKMNKELYELQTYLTFDGEKEIDRSNAIKSFVREINQKNSGIVAKQIPSIPEKLTIDVLEKNYALKEQKYLYSIGLDYSTVDVVYLNFREINEFCLIGKDIAKKQFVLNSMLMAVENKILTEDIMLYIIDSVERPLKVHADKSYVEKYTIDYTGIGTIIDEIYPELERRYEVLMEEGLEGIQSYPLYMILINNRDVIEYMCTTKEIMNAYNKILKQFKSLGIVFIFSDIEDATVAYGAPELLKKFKENKKAIVTSNLNEFKFCDIPSNVVRNSKALGYGDTYLMNGTDVLRIKLIEED